MDWYFSNLIMLRKLKIFSKSDNNTIKTPIDISVHLSKIRDKRTNQLEYSWIWTVQSLVLLTRLANYVDL